MIRAIYDMMVAASQDKTKVSKKRLNRNQYTTEKDIENMRNRVLKINFDSSSIFSFYVFLFIIAYIITVTALSIK